MEGVGLWVGRGGTALLDQAATSATTLATSVLLARWLSPSGYGTFALGLALLFLLVGAHIALVTEPMSVFGSEHVERSRAYLAAQLRLHVLVSVVAVAFLWPVAAVLAAMKLHNPAMVAFGVGVAAPAALLAQLARRFVYLLQQPFTALLGSASQLLIAVGVVVVWEAARATTPLAGFAALAAGGLAGSAVILWRTHWLLPADEATGDDAPSISRLAREQWRFGSWLLGSAALTWLSRDAFYVFAFAVMGAPETAVLRAAANVVAPIDQAITALGIFTLPMVARLARGGEPDDAQRAAWRLSAVAGGAAIGWLLVVALAGQPVMRVLYGGGYAGQGNLLVLLALVPVLRALGAGPLIALLAQRRSATVFSVNAVATAATLGLTVLLARHLGLAGLATGWIIFGSLQLVLWHRAARCGFSAPSQVTRA